MHQFGALDQQTLDEQPGVKRMVDYALQAHDVAMKSHRGKRVNLGSGGGQRCLMVGIVTKDT